MADYKALKDEELEKAAGGTETEGYELVESSPDYSVNNHVELHYESKLFGWIRSHGGTITKIAKIGVARWVYYVEMNNEDVAKYNGWHSGSDFLKVFPEEKDIQGWIDPYGYE